MLGLAAAMWSVDDGDVIDADPPRTLTHRVRLDGETACWLTWTVTPRGDGTTYVRLAHDEADLRPGPPPELDVVLAALAGSIREASIG